MNALMVANKLSKILKYSHVLPIHRTTSKGLGLTRIYGECHENR